MPEPPVGCEVGAAATVVASSLAVGVAEAFPDAVAPADGVGLADALAEGRLDADPVDPGVAPRVVGEVDPGVALVALVGLVAGVGFFVGSEVALGLLVVGAGLLVAVGAGGATRGCWPDPNRNPTTVPGAGLKLATPVEL